MKKFNLYVGIDISKNTLDVAIGRDEKAIENLSFSNDAKGIGQLISKIESTKVPQIQVLICCEHTGVYLDKLAYAIGSTDCFLWVVHPLLLKNYSTEINRFKTDKADAKRIRSYSQLNESKAHQYKRAEQGTLLLRDLFSLRKQLLQTRTQYLNRKDALKQKVAASVMVELVNQTLLNFLTSLIKEVENEINKIISTDKKTSNLYQILVSIPGVGPVIAQHILHVTDCFEKFKDWKSFACYIGTAPNANQSGKIKRRARVSKHAYKPLKADLNQGVLSIIRPGQIFHDYYNYLISLNYHHLYILNKLKNMIIKTVFTLVQKEIVFDKEIFLKNKKMMS